MSRDKGELKPRDKVVTKMTREGAVKENLTENSTERISKRLEETKLVQPSEAKETAPSVSEEELKAQLRKRQVQEHKEDAQEPPSQPDAKEQAKDSGSVDQSIPHGDPGSPLHSSEIVSPAPVPKHVVAETVLARKLTRGSDAKYVDSDAVLSRAGERSSPGTNVPDEPVSKRLEKLEKKSEIAHAKLDAARDKLPRKKVLKSERVFDDAAGKAHTKLHFEDEIKQPKTSGKLTFEIKKDVRKLGDSLGDAVHGKLHEVEQENTGVEAAHKSEIVAEKAVRGAARHERSKSTKPYEKVSKLEEKADKADFNVHYEKTVQENPAMKGSGRSKFYQKQQIKKEYAAARKAGTQTAGTAGKAASSGAKKTGEKASEKIGEFVRKNKKVFVWLGIGVLIVIFFVAGISACFAMFGQMGSGVIASSYLSEDDAMLGAEAQYCSMEADLQYELDHYASLHPGYDEYQFDLDDIQHDPYVLISILSALHGGEFTLADVQGTLGMLFDKQYIITTTEEIQVRYRTETRTGSYTVTDPDTGETSTEDYEYDVQVPYNYYILHVELENFNLSHVPVYIMGQDELSMYAMYMSTLGNREDLFPSSSYVSKYITNPPDDYEVPAAYLDDATFNTLITEAEKYLGYPYVWGGSNPDTSFDCSGFVSWVLTNSGLVNTGRLGAQGLYNVCTPVSSADAQPGDLIFFVGTYDTPGVSHVGIYVGDGVMLHCGDPIQYTSINTSYWQQHFYAFGRPHY